MIIRSIRIAGFVQRLISSRRLQTQLVSIVCIAVGAALLAARAGDVTWGSVPVSRVDPTFALLWAVGAACAIGAAFQAKYHRLAALVMVGGTGLITCLTFAWFSAPDLALTQITVEVVTVVLILLGLRWLPRRIEMDDPRRRTVRARARRARDVLIATLVGASAASLVFAVLTRPRMLDLSAFFVEHSLPQAGGGNVVNVILVDFRAFDTFGEITVVGIVALTVYALLRRFRPAVESIDLPRAQREDLERRSQLAADPNEVLPSGFMMVPAVLVRLLLPMAGLVSLFFLLRGHDLPGGGFIGGLVLATAVIVQYMVGGALWVEARTRIQPLYWIAVGLLAAGTAGIAAWFASRTFLTSLTYDLHLPLIGEVHLSTTLWFDIGVYMLVVGATVLMLVALAHQSLRSYRRPVGTPPAAGLRVGAAAEVDR